ncbi:DUF6020 family protein [Bifidobacterium xylocopae]|uniref:Beta-carotene 15,15'-monooxygenase n=1 Tax=Bifidobacterium xylocopae TaxID=2493119 RepID=A0A366KDB0_9BIFI|nr:DUF6020 family protein [Bifidobacterium xylocopae]RBP99093.1 hypothetical protein CRD59_05435 [Bifidobacterium xylocopae]
MTTRTSSPARTGQPGAVHQGATSYSGKSGRLSRWAGWILTTLACTWMALCIAVGPIYRADGGIADFGPFNYALLLASFVLTMGLAIGFSRRPGHGPGTHPLTAQASGRGLARLMARLHDWPCLRPLRRLLWRLTRGWKPLLLLLLAGWSWIWVTLLAAYGADLVSQTQEVASWLAERGGARLPYLQGPTIMDVYPTAHYLWPQTPTYLTDQHNLPLTLLYGSSIALSRRLTGAGDLAVILLAGLQLVFAAFCCAVTADRFFQPARACHLTAHPEAQGLPEAGTMARVLTLLAFLAGPLAILSTISLTKSPLFAWAFLWWTGLAYELRATRQAGLPLRWRARMAFMVSTLVMLCSAKYAVYIVAIQLLVLLLSDRRRWRLHLLCLLTPLLVFEATMGMLTGSGTVIKGDPIEGKGIQLQQIARVAQRNPSGIPADARADLVPIMDLDAAGFAYTPKDADRVKSSGPEGKIVVYRWKTVSASDMRGFNRAWARIGERNPVIYLDAFLAKSYGYFDPADHAYVPMAYYVNNGYVQEDSAWIRYWCHGWRDWVAWFARAWAAVPVLGWPASGNCWVLAALILLCCEALRGRWGDILDQLPLLLLMGVMIAAPANNFERHMLPVVFALPFLLIAFHRRSVEEAALSPARQR